MIFTTLKFLIFFVIVFLLYYIVPKKLQWGVLLIASLYFYLCASVKYAIFLLLATLITYFGAIIINKIDEKKKLYFEENKDKLSKEEKKFYKEKCNKKRKLIVVLCIVATIGILVIMKYSNFIIENFSLIINIFGFKFDSPAWNFILPLGISFYTFMSIGYVVDVYREEYPPEKNFLKYLLFVSYFPHILQGPIDKYNELSKSLYSEKVFDYEQAVQALYRMVIGVFKKLIIADKISAILMQVSSASSQYFGWNVLIVIVLYAIQLYSDFSGYMDIAIGCSKMLGISIAENFNAPYFSKSIAEYWRRWHISLGAWFRDYLYYPILRGKVATKIRNYFKNKNHKYLANNMPNVFALSIFWILVGFWHGATWAYVLYGMYYGVIIIASTLLTPVYNKYREKFPRLVKSKVYGAFEILRTFLLVLIAYFLFWLGDLKQAIVMFGNMFMRSENGFSIIQLFGKEEILCITFGTIVLIILDVLTIKNINIYEKFRKIPFILRWLIYIIYIFGLILFVGGATQEFLYFQF